MKVQECLSRVESPYLKTGIPRFRIGDTLRVFVKVVEGESERIQPFEGIVLSRRGSNLSETFTVRKISFGVGIERTFPLHSPRIEKIELVKSGRVRRAKLFYLRKLSGKAARLTSKKDQESSSEPTSTPEPEVLSEPQIKDKKSAPEPATISL